MNMKNILEFAVTTGASDLFLVAGRPISYKLNGEIRCLNEERVMPGDLNQLVKEIYELADNREMEAFLRRGDDDFSFAIPGLARFRASTYKQ